MVESQRQTEYLRAIYTPQPPSSHRVDIVFVHGLNPNSKPDFAISTWTHEQGNFWPKAQLPRSIPSARILLFSYNSQVAWDVSSNGIQEHANNLLDRLSGARESEPKPPQTVPIIFVAHSLGGLVVKHALVTAKNNDAYKDIRDATYGLVFFAVPHQGGHGATLGAIAKNIVISLTGDSRNDLVESLQRNSLFQEDQANLFKYQLEDFHIVSIFEDRPTKFTRFFGRATSLVIVDKKSATLGLAGTREKLLTVNSNHSDVCKFEGDDDKFEPIKRAIGKLAGDSTEKEKRAATERAQISPGPPVESLQRDKERKLCPFPVASFMGRNSVSTRAVNHSPPSASLEDVSHDETRNSDVSQWLASIPKSLTQAQQLAESYRSRPPVPSSSPNYSDRVLPPLHSPSSAISPPETSTRCSPTSKRSIESARELQETRDEVQHDLSLSQIPYAPYKPCSQATKEAGEKYHAYRRSEEIKRENVLHSPAKAHPSDRLSKVQGLGFKIQ